MEEIKGLFLVGLGIILGLAVLAGAFYAIGMLVVKCYVVLKRRQLRQRKAQMEQVVPEKTTVKKPETIKFRDGNYQFTLQDDGSAVINRYTGDASDVVIPSRLCGRYPVVSFARSAFEGKQMTSVVIPDSVTSIGECTFKGCENLTSVMLPESVTSLGGGAFEGCTALISIRLPESLPGIERFLFNQCESLTSIVLPEGISFIGKYAFQGCTNLQSVIIPDTVNVIGQFAFSECVNLASVNLPESLTEIAYGTFFCCSNLPSIRIPKGVTKVEGCAFNKCSSLASVSLPDSLEMIDMNAFGDCSSLTEITLPDSITTIGKENPFRGCTELLEIHVAPDHPVLEIRDGVLFNKSNKRLLHYPPPLPADSYSIPDGTVTIGRDAFYNCDNLVTVTFPESVKSIRDYAFCECQNLTNVILPDSSIDIDFQAFTLCPSLKSDQINEINRSSPFENDSFIPYDEYEAARKGFS